MIGHDDPLATMSLDEINAACPVDPSTLPPPAEFLAHLKGLASDDEREWFRARVLGDFPEMAATPMADIQDIAARIESNEARLAALEAGGPDASRLMDDQQRLMWTYAHVRELQAQNQQWARMQPTGGTLLSRGRG